jgi:Protein of unknown function (DUF5661)
MFINDIFESELLDKPTLTAEQVAKKHGVSIDHVNQQLVHGIKHEHEHTSNTALAREIALDHLGEDPNYYTKLNQVEKVDEEDDMFAAPKVTAKKLAALMQAGKELWVKDTRNDVWKIHEIIPAGPGKKWMARWEHGMFAVGDDEYKLDILEPDESAYMLRPVHRFAESDDMFSPGRAVVWDFKNKVLPFLDKTISSWRAHAIHKATKENAIEYANSINIAADELLAIRDEMQKDFSQGVDHLFTKAKADGPGSWADEVTSWFEQHAGIDASGLARSAGHDPITRNVDESDDDDMFAPGPSALVRAKHLLDKSKSVYIEHPYYDEVLPVFSIYVDENTPHRYSDSVTVLLKNWRHLEHEVNADEWTLAPFANGFVLKKKATNEDAEVLDEGASSVLYHYTSPRPAFRILQSGKFELTSSVGSREETKLAPKGYPYYMSTTRSKVGDYHSRIPGSHAVMFVLDGNKIAQNYKVKPVDYWEGMWQRDNSNQRTRESEDRVFSKNPTIPTDGIIKEIHQLITDHDEFRSPVIRNIAILAKTQGIPIYFYTDKDSWLTQSPKNRVAVSQIAASFKGPMKPMMATRRRRISPLQQWLELIFKKNKAELSQEANELRFNMVTYGARYPEEDQGLSNELTNARKPGDTERGNADKIIQYMRQNRMTSTADLKAAMIAKWSKTP